MSPHSPEPESARRDTPAGLQLALACPVNKLGSVDVYQAPHHGNGVAPQLPRALDQGDRQSGRAELLHHQRPVRREPRVPLSVAGR